MYANPVAKLPLSVSSGETVPPARHHEQPESAADPQGKSLVGSDGERFLFEQPSGDEVAKEVEHHRTHDVDAGDRERVSVFVR